MRENSEIIYLHFLKKKNNQEIQILTNRFLKESETTRGIIERMEEEMTEEGGWLTPAIASLRFYRVDV